MVHSLPRGDASPRSSSGGVQRHVFRSASPRSPCDMIPSLIGVGQGLVPLGQGDDYMGMLGRLYVVDEVMVKGGEVEGEGIIMAGDDMEGVEVEQGGGIDATN